MTKKIILLFLLGLSFLIGTSNSAFAFSNYLTDFNTKYGTAGTALDSCGLCHTNPAGGGRRNSYGLDFQNNSQNFASIETLDSDGDGFNNLTEINAKTLPGDSNSKPVTTPPTTGDTLAPVITGFSLPATANTLTVPITTLTATDNVAVTGYMVTESATTPTATASGWQAAAPASFTFPTAGVKTLNAWAKDAAGNISAGSSASVTITLTTPPPTGGTNGPDLSPWVGKWFKLHKKNLGYQTANAGLKRDTGNAVTYLKIWSWDAAQKTLQGDLYGQILQIENDHDRGEHRGNANGNNSAPWITEPFAVTYFAGSNLDFLGSSQVNGDLTAGFAARIKGWKEDGTLSRAIFQTLGGYYTEVSTNASGVQEFGAGGLSIFGIMVPDSKVPVPTDVIIVH